MNSASDCIVLRNYLNFIHFKRVRRWWGVKKKKKTRQGEERGRWGKGGREIFIESVQINEVIQEFLKYCLLIVLIQ